MQTIKQFDTVIAAVSRGDTISLGDMPPTPTLPSCTAAAENTASEGKEESASQRAAPPPPGNNY